MTEAQPDLSLLIFLVGAAAVASVFIRLALRRIRLPPLLGFLALGCLLRAAGTRWDFLTPDISGIFAFLADVGIVCLLFRVGLESKPAKLLGQLRPAGLIWVGNVLLSGVFGFAAGFWLLQVGMIPSLVLAIAFTATSVGVSTAIWQEQGALQSPNGQLLIDVAELDDISGIILMALLFALLPLIQQGDGGHLLEVALTTAGRFLLSLILFAGFCALFARYAEKPFSKFFGRIQSRPSRTLLVVGTGFMIAAFAGLLGFSVAIGAFFAGLVFSRHAETVGRDTSFGSLYELFTPFFFIGIGLNIAVESFATAFGWGLVLFVAATLGKVLGAGAPAWFLAGAGPAVLIGLSLVPRAEIAMLIMQQGLRLGEWAIPPQLFSAMVVVSALTCIGAPLAVHPLLRRWPQPKETAA